MFDNARLSASGRLRRESSEILFIAAPNYNRSVAKALNCFEANARTLDIHFIIMVGYLVRDNRRKNGQSFRSIGNN